MTTTETLFAPVATRAVVEPAHPDALYIAVVHAPDGVRLATMADSRATLVQRLADYVDQRGDDMLWADHARHLRTLLARGELEVAIETYFGLVGDRWDEEWLVTTVLKMNGQPDVAAALGAVAPPMGAATIGSAAASSPRRSPMTSPSSVSMVRT